MRRVVILLFVVAACSPEGDLPRTSELGVALTFPDTLTADVTDIRLEIFDEFADCVAETAVGGSLIQSEMFAPGVPTTIRVSSGPRVFHAVGLELDLEVAEGCTRVNLLEGQMVDLQIDMVEIAPAIDAGL